MFDEIYINILHIIIVLLVIILMYVGTLHFQIMRYRKNRKIREDELSKQLTTCSKKFDELHKTVSKRIPIRKKE